MDKQILESIGLSEKEISTYFAILKVKEITPVDLAKALKVKRTTAYSMARGLLEKGLIIEDSTKRPRRFVLADGNELDTALEQEKKRHEEKIEAFSLLKNTIEQVKAEENYPVPKIRFIEEEGIDSFLHSRTQEWIKSMKEVSAVFWGYQDPSLLNYFQPWIKSFWDKCPKDFETKLLTNSKDEEIGVKGKYDRRYTKFWYGTADFLSTTWVIGDYVVTLNTQKKPFYLIETHDKLIAHDQREMFKNLWKILE
jgi:sugar-specific transcriptional regulator TrmB